MKRVKGIGNPDGGGEGQDCSARHWKGGANVPQSIENG